MQFYSEDAFYVDKPMQVSVWVEIRFGGRSFVYEENV